MSVCDDNESVTVFIQGEYEHVIIYTFSPSLSFRNSIWRMAAQDETSLEMLPVNASGYSPGRRRVDAVLGAGSPISRRKRARKGWESYPYLEMLCSARPSDLPFPGIITSISFPFGIIFLAPFHSRRLTEEYFIKFSSTSTLWPITSFTSIQNRMNTQRQLSENTDVGSGSNQYVDASSQCHILIFPRCN